MWVAVHYEDVRRQPRRQAPGHGPDWRFVAASEVPAQIASSGV